jgi:hypothetical protein
LPEEAIVRNSVGRVKPAPSVHTRTFDGELVILDLAAGEYYTLDVVGARLWSALEGGRTVGDVAREIAAEYDVAVEKVEADFLALADDFLRRGLFVRVESP